VVEACDPLEDEDHAYQIDGITVSDFYTPNYFDDALRPGIKYSFNGAIVRPREIKPNGYISWMNPSGRLQQLRWFDQPAIIDLPDHSTATTLEGEPLSHRAFIDRNTLTPRLRKARAC
jgi:hypothetical protein